MIEVTPLRDTPSVWLLNGVITPEEGEALLALCTPPPGVPTQINRTGLCFERDIEGEPLLEDLRGRLERLLGYESGLGYTFRVRRYGPGNGHPPHLDCYSAEGLDLLATVMLVLHTPEQGGDTHFPLAQPSPLSVPAQAGRALLWYNHLPDGQPDPLSRHSGEPVLAGEKVVMLYFFYAPANLAWVRLGPHEAQSVEE